MRESWLIFIGLSLYFPNLAVRCWRGRYINNFCRRQEHSLSSPSLLYSLSLFPHPPSFNIKVKLQAVSSSGLSKGPTHLLTDSHRKTPLQYYPTLCREDMVILIMQYGTTYPLTPKKTLIRLCLCRIQCGWSPRMPPPHLKGDGAQSAGKVPLLSLLRLYGMDESYMRRFGPQNRRRRRTKGELEEGRKLGGTDGEETARFFDTLGASCTLRWWHALTVNNYQIWVVWRRSSKLAFGP